MEYKPLPPILGLPEADALNSTHCKPEESISADNKPNDDELTFFELKHSFQGSGMYLISDLLQQSLTEKEAFE